MARQRIHNSRSGTGAGNAGASWISYSDIMAALLLLFVLILSVSLYQYFTMSENSRAQLDAKEQALTNQKILLDEQKKSLDNLQIILLSQQDQLDEQNLKLAAQQVTMDNQKATIVLISKDLELQEKKLNDQSLALEKAIATNLKQEAELEKKEYELKLKNQELGNIVGVKAEIIQEVTDALRYKNVDAKVDPNSGDIIIDSTMLRFESNKADLTAESRAFLDRFVPVYLQVLMQPKYENYLGSIIIEGHTDSSGTYERNMALSQDRALSVLLYIRNMPQLDSATRFRLEQILVATGKGPSELIYEQGYFGPYENPDASRRVEFKFSLRDAEMLQEIRDLLNQYTY